MKFSLFILKKIIKSKSGRNFFSFIPLISISGIALGVGILILALSVLYGFENTIEEKIIDFTSHITISGFSGKNLPSNKELTDSISTLCQPYINSISPFLSKNAIIKHGKFSEGILIEGISPRKDNSNIKRFLIKGKYFSGDSSRNEIIIGEKLAEKLFLKTGEKITLFTLRNDRPPSFDNPPAIDNFTVIGIYRSGMAEYDDAKAYTTLSTLQEITDLQGFISGYYIKVNNIKAIPLIVFKLQERLGYPYYVRDFHSTHRNIFTWLELQKKPVPLIFGLIILVAAFNIIGALLMNILQKLEMIGILRTLGATKKMIKSVFLVQGVFYSLVGIVLGNLFAYTISLLQLKFKIISLPASVYFISSAPIYIDWKIYLAVSLITFSLVTVTSLIPSNIASKLQPIKALRFE